MDHRIEGYIELKKIIIVICICFIGIYFSNSAYSQQPDHGLTAFRHKYLFSFETKKEKTEQAYGKPRTAAIDSTGRIFVVIPYAKEIRVYDSQGQFLFVFGKKIQKGKEEKGCFSEPSGIAIDNENQIFITDLDLDKVLIFDSKGEFREEFPIFQPAGKSDACAPFIGYNAVKKLLYIPDPCTQRICIYKTTGEFITFFGDKGNALGKFGGPANCAFDGEGNIFIVDPGNFRVQYFTPLHKPLITFGSMGTENGEFVRPYGITVDLKGRIYISDIVLKSVQVFDKKGNFISVIKDAEYESEIIKQPMGIVCSRQNGSLQERLYIVDGEALKIHVFQIN